ncbi:xanthine dehydrogenase family protein subunit M [Actinokineospora sp. UTMC 2448]|uniref:FAD binding domain-containing protein n=1 Tax=Actinokineospora sp. UTMC 2448 TaxID=2268449 RepID=UPI002164730E|nr:FAD binding domain-containing protein [Actinokineospora sp. UTMC 2448]UVS78095.1 Nicotinate dehydrogenase FAD-subunit [Actinokineospora sp. UTMC 2448]
MEFMRPTTLAEALAMKAATPEAVPIAGGTDVMVEINFDKRRPGALLDLSSVAELSAWDLRDDGTRIGAALPYARVIAEVGERAPGLAAAARTVGSPQIRNRGSVGGNLGSASPAGDAHPPLLADGSAVEIASVRGTRTVPAREFFTGPKKSVLEPDELVTAVLVPAPRGPQQFAKVGTRNAMVIAVCSFAVALDTEALTVGTGIGSAGPTPLRAVEAERFAAGLDWDADLPESAARRFGDLVAQAARPIDDVRGTAAYRRHALGVLARRTLTWAWAEYRRSGCA